MTITSLNARRFEPPKLPTDSGLARLFAGSRERDRASEGAREAAELEAKLDTIPDATFNNDREIAALRADRDAKQRRAEQIVGGAALRCAKAAVADIQGRIAVATGELRLAAIDDTLDGDFKFKRAASIVKRITALRAQLDAAQAVIVALDRNPLVVESDFNGQAREAGNALALALRARKRELLARAQADVFPVSAGRTRGSAT